MSRQPFYKFADFLKACSEKQNVIPIENVMDDARRHFGLQTFTST